VLEQPNRGASVARNVGAATAQGELLLFLDDDMEADPGLLAAHDRRHRDGADAVLGHLALHPDSPRNLLSQELERWEHERLARLTAPDAALALHDLLTGQISVSRRVFDAVGAFDTGFTRDGAFGGEDLDFGYRLLRGGHRVVFEPAAISAQRYVVPPDAAYFRRLRETGRSDAQLSRKHPERAREIRAQAPRQALREQVLFAPLSRLPVVGRALTAALRALVIRRMRAGRQDGRTQRILNAVRTLEYQRGVADAGGVARPGSVVVLAYHAIADLDDDPVLSSYAVPPARFAAHVDALTRSGHRFVDLDAVLAGLAGTAALPARGVLLTFDDCYADLADTVAPLLAERGIPAVAFAVSGALGGTNEWDRRLRARTLRLLDADALRAVGRQRIEIGAHTRTHPDLTTLGDAELADEVSASRGALADAGLPWARGFAYPYGAWDARVEDAVADAGYDAAFTLVPGAIRGDEDAHRLPRMEVRRGDTPRRLRLMVAAASAPPWVLRAATSIGLVRSG
jgi:peptidoglycan/xylan/chitin deacetylase (PgdA/CDA1 family)